MNTIIEKLKQAAQAHGEDSGEQEHQVGDLEDMLTTAWNLMSVSQKELFVRHECVSAVIEAGARGEFSQDTLFEEIRAEIDRMEKTIHEIGMRLAIGKDDGWIWFHQEPLTASAEFDTRTACIQDAYAVLTRHVK